MTDLHFTKLCVISHNFDLISRKYIKANYTNFTHPSSTYVHLIHTKGKATDERKAN